MDTKIKFILTGAICLIIGLAISFTLEKEPSETLVVKDTVVDSLSLWDSIGDGDREKVYDTANEYVKNASVKGIKYSLFLDRKVGNNWLVFHVIPISPITDVAQLFLEKSSGVWVVRGFGTAFPDLYDKHPELFK